MDYESQLRLERDAAIVRETLEAAGGQLIQRTPGMDEAATDPPGLYWAIIAPAESGNSPLVARIKWAVYPDRPPSVLFAMQVGGPTDVRGAWPAATGYRAPVDICKPFTAEGQALHAEWATGTHAWVVEGNPFLYVVENLQGDINRVRGARAA